MHPQPTPLDRRLRACDLDALPHEWDTRYELVGGVLFMSRRPSTAHQEAIARLIVALHPAVAAVGGRALPEAGVLWEPDGEDNVVPDVVVVLPDRLGIIEERIHGSPSIVIEVLSSGPEARRRDLEAKRALYFRRGVVEYWVIDLLDRHFLRMTRGSSEWMEEKLSEGSIVRTPLLPSWCGMRVGDLLPPS